MGLIDRNREPTPGELRIFGVLMTVFGGLVGLLVWHRTGSLAAPKVIWVSALLLTVFYYAVPSLQFVIFRAWMTVAYPIGWVLSHTLLATIYYFVLTPIAFLMRLFGRDPLQRSFDRGAKTYWTGETAPESRARYFHQY